MTLLLWRSIEIYSIQDFKPGPYPKTEEERRKAAEKYGLSPEEYEPYPDDGNGYGDYPKLPLIGAAAKDPFYPWDNPAFRRNMHETVNFFIFCLYLLFLFLFEIYTWL